MPGRDPREKRKEPFKPNYGDESLIQDNNNLINTYFELGLPENEIKTLHKSLSSKLKIFMNIKINENLASPKNCLKFLGTNYLEPKNPNMYKSSDLYRALLNYIKRIK